MGYFYYYMLKILPIILLFLLNLVFTPISCATGFVAAPDWTNGCVKGKAPEQIAGIYVPPPPGNAAAASTPKPAAAAQPAAPAAGEDPFSMGGAGDDAQWFRR